MQMIMTRNRKEKAIRSEMKSAAQQLVPKTQIENRKAMYLQKTRDTNLIRREIPAGRKPSIICRVMLEIVVPHHLHGEIPKMVRMRMRLSHEAVR